MNAPLAEMFRYNKWANLTLLDDCLTLTDEQLDARIAGVSGSVRELLLHVVGGQQTFILRTKGRQHEGELSRSSPWPGLPVLSELAMHSSDELVAIAEGMDAESDVDLPWQGRVYRYPKSFFLVHAVAHGAEHRAEVKFALAQLGIQTSDLDAWLYAPAAGYGEEVQE